MTFDSGSNRVTEARFGLRAGRKLATATTAVALLAGIVAVVVFIAGSTGLAVSLAGICLVAASLVTWLRREIMQLTPALIGTTEALDQLLPAPIAARYHSGMTTLELWHILATSHWQCGFVVSRLGLYPELINGALAAGAVSIDEVWPAATALAQAAGSTTLTPQVITGAILTASPGLAPVLTAAKLQSSDVVAVVAWLTRYDQRLAAPRPIYGGIARDWAAGYTPMLTGFGTNISAQVEAAGNRFALQERTSQLDGLIAGLGAATGSVVVVGEPGIGKTALLYGLADRLLQGKTPPNLAHHQIFSLNASVLVAHTQGAGDLERIIIQLMNEAAHAGNIVLALDEAQLFFGQGTGAVNLANVLLPVLQSRGVRLVMAFTPGDWQRLRVTNGAIASLLTPLILTESDQSSVVALLADRALGFEQGRYTTTYAALIEAYRLSDRYYTEEAQPGKSLKLLEASYNHAENGFLTPVSVQRAVESQLGVKIEQAAGTDEADALLNLEDRIHERMINQTRAVSVVAAALRRARAGVSNPKRPVGSFLFLGPTGVGKTELARSLAAIYFGSERNMIRLDMSEYQQASDVSRILAGAAENPQGLLGRVRTTPFAVVLFDEIEKADPNILNLMLQLLDEGNLTDSQGHATSFKDTIIIATSNAGADEIRRHIEAGEQLEQFEQAFTDQLINSGQFKPELLNRFDEIVLFRPLNPAELGLVVKLLIAEVNRTLEPQKIQVTLTDLAIVHLIDTGYDPRLGARPMRRMVTRTVEDAVAGRILRGEVQAGSVIALTRSDVGGQAEPAPLPEHAPQPPRNPSVSVADGSGTLYRRGDENKPPQTPET